MILLTRLGGPTFALNQDLIERADAVVMDLRGFTASWNSIYFNQGSPKPAGNRPGLTRAVRGTYNAKTGHYVLTWVSQIVGGPFNDTIEVTTATVDVAVVYLGVVAVKVTLPVAPRPPCK